MVTIKILPGRSSCRARLPVFSDGLKGGQILLREEYCVLPAGHTGMHRSASGGFLHNRQTMDQELEQNK
jgi:hypothetical protein